MYVILAAVAMLAQAAAPVALAGPPAAPAVPAARGSYTLTKSIALGVPDRWDYVVFDGGTGRVFVAHGDRLAVIDTLSERVVGEVEGISGGTHGTAVAQSAGLGFTDDGRAGKVVAFDLHSLKITKEIAADVDADGLALDPITGRLFVVEGDPNALTVIDTKTVAPVATIKAGEKLEYAVADGKGAVYVAGEGKGDVLKIDARTNRIAARWPTPGCISPHGMAFDAERQRVFMGCKNSVMMVVDAKSGRTVAKLPIGRGNDAVAFDLVRNRVFSSNGIDGTISGYQQVTPDIYVPLPPITTMVSARTMAVDPLTGRLFVAGADTSPNPDPNGRPIVKAGTLRLLVFRPAN